jgi:hypothetical protein
MRPPDSQLSGHKCIGGETNLLSKAHQEVLRESTRLAF